VDVPLGIGCIFVSPNPHPAVGYMKQKPALVLTNGSCAMSLNSNHVVLNTMPNVIVDVGLPTHTQTNNVKDLPRSGRPRITSDRDDRTLQRLVRQMPFATSPVLKQHWLPNRRLSTRTVRNRLKSAGPADYSIVVAHLTSNSFEGHPCCMHANYLPSLCF
jgi:hypothetical protein